MGAWAPLYGYREDSWSTSTATFWRMQQFHTSPAAYSQMATSYFSTTAFLSIRQKRLRNSRTVCCNCPHLATTVTRLKYNWECLLYHKVLGTPMPPRPACKQCLNACSDWLHSLRRAHMALYPKEWGQAKTWLATKGRAKVAQTKQKQVLHRIISPFLSRQDKVYLGCKLFLFVIIC